MPGTPAGHARQQPPLREGRQHRHAQALFAAGRGGSGGLQPFVQQRHCSLHAAQQGGARGVQDDAPAGTFKQRKTDLLFQHLDLLADCAVRQVQAFGRGAQVLQLGDDAEGGEGIQR
ncbi:hypothetical protein D3C72_1932840 [compost metagenome]